MSHADDVPGLLRRVVTGDAAEALDDLAAKLYDQGSAAAVAVLPFLLGFAEPGGCRDRAGALELIGGLVHEATTSEPRHIDAGWAAAWRAALPRVLALLGDPDAGLRRQASETLSSAVDDADLVVPALREAWATETDPAARLAIIVAVGELGRGCGADVLPETLLWLRGLRERPDPATRLAASLALADIIPAEHPDPDLLAGTIGSPGAADWREAPWGGGAADRLVTWVDAKLAGDAPARTRLIAALLGHADPDRRIGAAKAAAQLLSERRSPAGELLPLLLERATDTAGPARAHATFALAGLGEGADVLAGRLDDGHPLATYSNARISDVAAWGLARLGDARCVPYLIEQISALVPRYCRHTAYGGDVPYAINSLPALPEALAPLHGHADALLPVIREGLHGDAAGAFAELLAGWGAAAAPALPDLVELLGTDAHLAAVTALGAIGAAEAAPAIEALLGRPPELGTPYAAQRSPVLLSWAHWRITGDPAPLLAVAPDAPQDLWIRVADLGPHAAAHAARFRALLRDRDDWTSVRAAHALYRITGDAGEVRDPLHCHVYTLTRADYLPVHGAALEQLAEIGPAPESVRWALRELLAADHRHRWQGGWRAFADDHHVRELATALLECRSPC